MYTYVKKGKYSFCFKRGVPLQLSWTSKFQTHTWSFRENPHTFESTPNIFTGTAHKPILSTIHNVCLEIKMSPSA